MLQVFYPNRFHHCLLFEIKVNPTVLLGLGIPFLMHNLQIIKLGKYFFLFVNFIPILSLLLNYH